MRLGAKPDDAAPQGRRKYGLLRIHGLENVDVFAGTDYISAHSATPVGGHPTSAALTDADFQAKWEQKGVDLRIGLDIVTMTESRAADLIVLVTGDTDLIPAMKLARGRGLQLAGLDLPNRKIIPELAGTNELAFWYA